MAPSKIPLSPFWILRAVHSADSYIDTDKQEYLGSIPLKGESTTLPILLRKSGEVEDNMDLELGSGNQQSGHGVQDSVQNAEHDTATSNPENYAHFEDGDEDILWVGGLKFKRSEVGAFQGGRVHPLNNGQTVQRPKDNRWFLECKYVYTVGLTPLPSITSIEGQSPIEYTHFIPGIGGYWPISKTPIQIEQIHYMVLHLLWLPLE